MGRGLHLEYTLRGFDGGVLYLVSPLLFVKDNAALRQKVWCEMSLSLCPTRGMAIAPSPFLLPGASGTSFAPRASRSNPAGAAWTNLPALRLAVGGLRLLSGVSPWRVPRCSVQKPAVQAVKMATRRDGSSCKSTFNPVLGLGFFNSRNHTVHGRAG